MAVITDLILTFGQISDKKNNKISSTKNLNFFCEFHKLHLNS